MRSFPATRILAFCCISGRWVWCRLLYHQGLESSEAQPWLTLLLFFICHAISALYGLSRKGFYSPNVCALSTTKSSKSIWTRGSPSTMANQRCVQSCQDVWKILQILGQYIKNKGFRLMRSIQQKWGKNSRASSPVSKPRISFKSHFNFTQSDIFWRILYNRNGPLYLRVRRLLWQVGLPCVGHQMIIRTRWWGYRIKQHRVES